MTPDPRLEARCVSASKRSPKKCRNSGSSRKGCCGFLTSLLVKIFTTAGVARFTAWLYDAGRVPAPLAGGAWVNSTICGPKAGRPSHSGFSVTTTNSTPSATVAAWAKTNHSLRIIAGDSDLRTRWEEREKIIAETAPSRKQRGGRGVPVGDSNVGISSRRGRKTPALRPATARKDADLSRIESKAWVKKFVSSESLSV